MFFFSFLFLYFRVFWVPGVGPLGLPRDSLRFAGRNGPMSLTASHVLTEHMIFQKPVDKDMCLC